MSANPFFAAAQLQGMAGKCPNERAGRLMTYGACLLICLMIAKEGREFLGLGQPSWRDRVHRDDKVALRGR